MDIKRHLAKLIYTSSAVFILTLSQTVPAQTFLFTHRKTIKIHPQKRAQWIRESEDMFLNKYRDKKSEALCSRWGHVGPML